jgi:hypothetical protein
MPYREKFGSNWPHWNFFVKSENGSLLRFSNNIAPGPEAQLGFML